MEAERRRLASEQARLRREAEQLVAERRQLEEEKQQLRNTLGKSAVTGGKSAGNLADVGQVSSSHFPVCNCNVLTDLQAIKSQISS